MIMTWAAGAAVTVHSRMPVILASADHAFWLDQEMPYAINLCRPAWAAINRTKPYRANAVSAGLERSGA
jgi:putative SOS response-associated peptidase YedK